MRYRLNLFSNFTYFLDDPVNGDQFEQADRRWITGGRLAHRHGFDLGGRQASITVGALTRRDDIGTIGLYHTAARERLGTVREDAVRQSSVGVFAENTVQWNSWARTTLGLRADHYRYTIDASNPLNGGRTSAGRVGPKAALILGPWQSTEFYVNAGNGFHSNDARGTTITVDPTTGEPAERVTPLVSAIGTEVGVRSILGRGIHTTVAVWQLDLESELLFVGDAGTTEAGRPSRRQGVEWSLFAAPNERLTFDADVSVARARFRDDESRGHVTSPAALERVASLGVTVENVSHLFGSLRAALLRGSAAHRGQLGAFASDRPGQRTVRRAGRAKSPRHAGRVQPLQLEGQRHRLLLHVASLRRAGRRRRRHPHAPGTPSDGSSVSGPQTLKVRGFVSAEVGAEVRRLYGWEVGTDVRSWCVRSQRGLDRVRKLIRSTPNPARTSEPTFEPPNQPSHLRTSAPSNLRTALVLPHHPRRHRALVLHDRGFDGIQELPAELSRSLHQERLVHEVAIGAVRQPISPAGGTVSLNTFFDTNRGGQSAKEHAARREQPPGAGKHRVERVVIAGKVKDGAAQDDGGESIGE